MNRTCGHPERPVDGVLVDGTSVCTECNPHAAERDRPAPVRRLGDGTYSRCSGCGRRSFLDPCRDCR